MRTPPIDAPFPIAIPPYQKVAEYTKNPAPYAAANSRAFTADFLVDNFLSGRSISFSSLSNSLPLISNDWLIRTDDKICSIRDEARPSSTSTVREALSVHQPRPVKMPIVNGIRAKRTPATRGAAMKAEMKHCMESASEGHLTQLESTVGPTPSMRANDHIRYPNLSPSPVRIELISLLARETISPGPIRSKNA